MQIITEGNLPEIPEAMTDFSPSETGIAVDIGTTTVAVALWSFSTRKILSVISEKNSQIKFGSDVIDRINFAIKSESNEKLIHKTIIEQLERMFSRVLLEASPKIPRGFRLDVKKIVITGNSTMLSFVYGCSVKNMATVPFEVASKFGFEIEWGKISSPKTSIAPSTIVYFPPVVGSFIGADTICALLCADFDFSCKSSVLLCDIGTNSEIALFLPYIDSNNNKPRLLCTSAAAGPAFEAANISSGLPSVSGAIESVSFSDNEFSVKTIGNSTAKGVCGSGLISSISVFLENGFIDKTGMIIDSESGKIKLTENVSITQPDIRNFQLAKAAVRTGIEFLMEKVDRNILPQTEFLLAGGFGSKLNLEESCKIGLIPEILLKNTKKIGNAALFGASALLFSEEVVKKAEFFAKNAVQINLAATPDFQSRFIKNLEF